MTKHNTTWEELKKEMLNSPEAKKAYEDANRAWKLREALIEAREHANLTQSELARKMNVAPSNLNKLEKHPDKANMATIFKYFDACNVKVDFVIS
ncbi:hypothetical protein A9G28_05870 [Gilliamella sp. Fer1-1]|jgi:DNA-binding XRE family transcriptional regulator|uniref:helix-turn-helix domain-containing protein n=1 Tax=Gilliamella sp. Fer1-1 TaxID=3120240 RepID=UPI00080EE3A3|nr:helix-turn-helix transcriptional regulator [Gilliamella apicola]OCG41726.1 hypothetical protein A9G28_05870 [Gilliamella apicola]